MTSWWWKGISKPNYVTKEHFDASIAGLENKFVTKQQFDDSMGNVNRRFDNLMIKLDGMATILQRLDQERIFTVEWIRRIESDLGRVKNHLKLA